jgi:hypothetical protein
MSIDFGFTIDFPVVGEWENVDQVRLSVQTCLATLFRDVDRRDQLVMVAGELLENAVKYARRTSDVTIFRFKLWGTMGATACVQVSNPVDSDGAKSVLEAVARIQAASSAAEAYCHRMLEIASAPTHLSRLGLLRIAYEGGCNLAAEHRDETLTVTATIPC